MLAKVQEPEVARVDADFFAEDVIGKNSGPEPLHFTGRIFTDPLLSSAQMSIALMGALPNLEVQGSNNMGTLRGRILVLLTEFRAKALHAQIGIKIVEQSLYVLTAAFDEFAARTSWGRELGWVNRPLISNLYFEKNSGDVFWHILTEAQKSPNDNLSLLLLMNLIMQLGFCGNKYQDIEARVTAVANLSSLLAPFTPNVGSIRLSTLCDQEGERPFYFKHAKFYLMFLLSSLLFLYIFSAVYFYIGEHGVERYF